MKEQIATGIAVVLVSGIIAGFLFKAVKAGHFENLHAKALAIEEDEHKDSNHKTPHWAYNGKGGPSDWGKLDNKFSLCASGKTQSPINITSSFKVADHSSLKFFYRPTRAALKNNGHTLQSDISPGLYFERDGVKFEMLQFHFHSPSEHKVEGVGSPLEVHFVHKDAQGNLGVIGFMIDEGTENSVFAPIWSALPAKSGNIQSAGQNIDISKLIPNEVEHFNYSGSLTTPPCSEGVNWFVMKQHIQFSKEQIAAYNAILSDTSRPVQPMNARRPAFFAR